jgi:L-ascorbate metabolism protein UlaG (beta-lactamase superfamily)
MPEDEMPEFLLLLREHGQNAVLDFRDGAVIASVVQGRAPALAMNVEITFEDRAGRAKNFSFEDYLSEPAVLVHNDNEISFRLMDMGDQVFYDEIRGSKLRPLTGSLGALFAVIGLAEIRSVRMAVADDGTTVSVATAQKSIVSVPGAVTTSPWGRTERGVSPSRGDLLEIERRLHEPLEFEYVDLDWDGVMAMTRGVAGVRRPLEVEFIGNMAMRLSDGADTIYSDFPYVSGAHGYMEYSEDAVRQAVEGITLVTHAHADHWDPERFGATGLELIAPPEISAGLPAERVLPWGDSIRRGMVEVQPVVTTHTENGAHFSYRVLWGDKRLYFTGDTDDPEPLMAERDLDVAFVSPWLLRAILAEGHTIDAKVVVVYHHTADEDVPLGPGIHVPTQGGTFRIR